MANVRLDLSTRTPGRRSVVLKMTCGDLGVPSTGMRFDPIGTCGSRDRSRRKRVIHWSEYRTVTDSTWPDGQVYGPPDMCW